MHTLVVVAHPDFQSLSHQVAQRLVLAASSADGHSTAELLDLAAAGFDPSFNAHDRAAYLAAGGYPADVRAEQERIEQAQHLVLVFPMYWWSFPALLKGWIDRVFAHGWAFSYDPLTEGSGLSGNGRLQNLTVHLVPLASGEESGYERRGYLSAFDTQIRQGIIGYCGAELGLTEFVWRSESLAAEEIEARITEISDSLRDSLAIPPSA